MSDLDTPLFRTINEALPEWLGYLFLGVTYLGSLPAVALWFGLIAVSVRKDRWLAMGYVTATVALAMLANRLLKNAVGRLRPWLVLASVHSYGPLERDFSFPSGHSTVSFALAVAVALWWPRARWPALALAAAVAFSRVVIGMHYPGDVIGGAVLGLIAAAGLFSWFDRRRRSMPTPLGTAPGEDTNRP
jgi:membrane-associated phospholipid phosphatase